MSPDPGHVDPTDPSDPCACDEHLAMQESRMASGLPALSDLTAPFPDRGANGAWSPEGSREPESFGDASSVERPTPDDDRKPTFYTRRRFVQALGAAGVVGYGISRFTSGGDQGDYPSFASERAATGEQYAALDDFESASVRADDLDGADAKWLRPAPVDQRVLVLIELAGGNDGLSTVVPYANGTYYDLRPNTAVPADQVLPLDSEAGLPNSLARLHKRQMATVEGVGPVKGSLSHFDMARRWDMGDILASGGDRVGFLGRLAAAVDTGAAVTGLSVAGHSPRLDGLGSALVLENLYQLGVLTNNEFIFPAYRAAMRSFTGGPMATVMAESWKTLSAVGRSLNVDPKSHEQSQLYKDGGVLGRQLSMASVMIKADVGVKVIHASITGFDTHKNHSGRHERLMKEVDTAVDGFLVEMEAAGLADRVLVATSSEFGRRVAQQGNGLDHGTASSMLLAGPIKPGRGGDPPSLADLDGNGNLKTTIPFDRYLASLAQDWLGVEAGSVLAGDPLPLGLLA